MAGPYDYSLGNVPDPSQAFTAGLQQGNAILQLGQQRQQQQLAMQAEQQKMQQQRMQAEALQGLMNNPAAGAADYSRVMTAIPSLSENLKRAWEVKSKEQQESSLTDLSQWSAAIQQGQPEFAVAKMTERADAMDKAAGRATPESQALRAQAKVIEQNPQFGGVMIKSILMAHPDGKRLVDNIVALGGEDRAAAKAPAELRTANAGATKAEADAVTAGVTAKYAERGALADLEKKGWDIKSLQADIEYKRQDTRIKAMNAAIGREGNDLKRQELRLKVQEAQGKLDDKVREKVATAEAGASSIDNMLNTIERVKKNPELNSVLGSIEGGAYYPNAMAGMLNPAGDGDMRNDAIALIDTLGSQAFLAQIPNIKGMGALSNAEGEKLQSALQNLSRKQSEKQFRENLDEAARLLKKGRESLSRSTGVPLKGPDAPAAPGARPPIDSFNLQR